MTQKSSQSKTSWPTAALIGASCLLAGSASTPAMAETLPTNLKVDYAIALGGFNLGTADVEANLGNGSYELDATVRTEGIADQFFETTFALESRGSFSGNRVKPARFISTYQDADSSRRVELTYPSRGAPVMAAEPAYGDGFGPHVQLNDILMTQDPISALLLPTRSTTTSPCDRSLPLFDGRRRYDLQLREDGMTEVNGGENAYSGPAMRCTVGMLPVAGYERKTLIKLLAREDSIRVWLAPLEGGDIWIPVRMTLRTPFGGAVMRATRFEVASNQ
ncbi:DUF3108 domain-containing protein [Parvibaculaceae bacterium PLY_AMNH_Bact1]|nr:DUF3108 domain-containing protein [Parvibaculaceae bacterium PLY_AMNH_Bact1]